MKSFSVLLLLISIVISSFAAVDVIVYQEKWQKGASFNVWMGPGCRALRANFRQEVQSVNTGGQCVLMCEGRNCDGKCIKVAPGCGKDKGCCPEHGDLDAHGCNFNFKTQTVKLC